MQAAHRVAFVGHLEGQDRHEEGFPFAALLAPQLPELRPGDPGPLHKVREVVFDQLLAEPFVSRLHRRVGGKYGASAHELARLVEGEPVLRHQRADPLEQQEGRVGFVDVIDARADSQPLEELDAPHPQQDFLFDPSSRFGTVKTSRDLPVLRGVPRHVGVQQVKRNAADMDFPDVRKECPAGKLDRDLYGLPPVVLDDLERHS